MEIKYRTIGQLKQEIKTIQDQISDQDRHPEKYIPMYGELLKELRRMVDEHREKTAEERIDKVRRIQELRSEIRKRQEKRCIKLPGELGVWFDEYLKDIPTYQHHYLVIAYLDPSHRFVIIRKQGYMDHSGAKPYYNGSEHWVSYTHIKGAVGNEHFPEEGRLTKELKKKLISLAKDQLDQEN